MTNREAALAVLNYQPYDRLPIVHFGYWQETLEKWCAEGHLTKEEITGYWDGNAVDAAIAEKLGFDFGWGCCFGGNTGLNPGFEFKVVEEHEDGSRAVMNGDGVVILQKPGAGSIPKEIEHLLKDRASWEEHYLPRLQFTDDRVNMDALAALKDQQNIQNPVGLACGSLYGVIRNWLGVEGSCYLYADDEDLFTEIIDTVGDLCFQVVERSLSLGVKFDFGHFWEDICYKSGPLIIPSVFAEKVGPHYKRITDLCSASGIRIVSLDCDGMIDYLIPIWLSNGVNTMFPIEVGTWNASIEPWREKYGKGLRGIGGMNKTVLSRDYAAVDAEVDRMARLVDLGGFLPCPDHRLPPDAKWENVQYYCERMRERFC